MLENPQFHLLFLLGYVFIHMVKNKMLRIPLEQTGTLHLLPCAKLARVVCF